MDGGMIFVLCLAAGFFSCVVYLAVLTRKSLREEAQLRKDRGSSNSDRLAS
jgi:hypothetical protein